MRKLLATIFIFTGLLLALVLLATGPISAQEPAPPPKGPNPTPAAPNSQPAPPPLQADRSLLPKIEPQLFKKLIEANGGAVPFIVYLKVKVDPAAAAALAPLNRQGKPDVVARRSAIVNALQQTARNSQAGVLQTLSNPLPGSGPGGPAPAAADIRPLWIVNAVAARGSLNMVLALAARSDVEVVRLDKKIRLNEPILDLRQLGCAPGPEPGGQLECASFLPALQSPQWGIAKIRADLVHNALDIDGAGVVVANIDTGVDWQHGALQTKYRGYTGAGKPALHSGNWHDATGAGATYPVDGNGHGTHTMGTMVGDNGIGVAPGARWIAAKAFDSAGNGSNSWLHDAFQWMLAPNGDPALAPDIVNNSWGNSFGAGTEFEADVEALLNAGIYPVFSAGNNGPGSGTVGSPGSLDLSFAVGATTIDDEIAIFSSRGPSPWGAIKPEVSAPGKDVVSTIPGGAYGSSDGTSMAAPHAAGLAALLLQASPTLSNNLSGISSVMMSTAVPLGSPIPNNNYGWGRIDAFNAVMSVAPVGTMEGAVTEAGSGLPIDGATIRISPRSGGPNINVTSSAGGTYQQGLAADTYDATASAFGYNPATAFNIVVVTGAAATQNFGLTARPTGTLAGTVRDKSTNAPLAAAITIDGTPAGATTNPADGAYSLSLPIGLYTATVVSARHRVTKAVNITINDGATVTRNFLLDSAPAILLVDSGQWYQESQIGFYQQTLDELLYPYDAWEIIKPFDTPNDIPDAAALANYDIVIWSAPEDSPGFIGADAALEDFLAGGGKLFLSGQDVAFFDGGGSIFGAAPYLKNYLKTLYLKDNAGTDFVSGLSGEPLAGLSLTISGGDGADNQVTPDVIGNANSDFARPLLAYDGGALAGLHIGLCTPYRAIFLPFGFEAINTGAGRSAVMEQAITWLMQTPPQTDLEMTPSQETLIGDFGTTALHTVRLRNTGSSNDLYSLSLSSGTPHNWPVDPAPPANVSLASCQSQVITLGVRVDTANSWHISDTRTLSAQSTNNPALIKTVTRTTKSPAPVLLVDDDRWFSFDAEFQEALDSNGVPYDYWFVPKSWTGPVPPSPPLEILRMYPMTVWYTAFDWFNPLTTPEEERLAAYLDGGGRLLFSSQDYIYALPDHQPSPFAENYLGILAHTEDFSSTVVIGQADNLVGAQLGPLSLTFPPGYNNWTDALTPTTTTQVATRGQANQPNGLIQAGTGSGGEHWHTNYFSFGPELLDSTGRTRLMQRSLGWLSWLGRSTVRPHTAALLDGTEVTYTAVVTNDGWYDLQTAIYTATFPAELSLVSHSPELNPVGGSLVWSGPLAKNQSKVFTYTAAIAGSLPLGTVINQTSWLAYPDHNLLFDRVASVKVNFPNLAGSRLNVTPTQGAEKNDTLTYTIVLKNTGLVDDPLVTTTNTLPFMLNLLSVDPPSQGAVDWSGNSLTWTTALAKDEAVTLTYRAVISHQTSGAIKNTAYTQDAVNEPTALTAWTTFKTLPIYLPVISKN